MPIIRNPFAKRPFNDENARPESLNTDAATGFERVDIIGSKASSRSIRSAKSQDNGDYKMSVVNDSGVYLPPSPTDDKGPRRPMLSSLMPSRSSMETRSSFGDIEHFSISRESFDSYRRSFDISAKRPVLVPDVPRQSLDSARFPRIPRASFRDRKFEPPAEDAFEDVGLNDEQKQQSQHLSQPRKRGFFAKFADSQDSSVNNHNQGMSRFIPGRKRGQSGQGAELGSIDRPGSSHSSEGEEMQ